MCRIVANRLTLTLVGTLAVAVPPFVQAQNYPNKPVRIISPYSPGDLVPRAIATALTESMGQQFLVDNRPGASQAIGMQAAAKLLLDGYITVYGGVTSLAINPAVTKDLPYDSRKDFASVSLCVTPPLFLVVHSSVPLREPEAA